MEKDLKEILKEGKKKRIVEKMNYNVGKKLMMKWMMVEKWKKFY